MSRHWPVATFTTWANVPSGGCAAGGFGLGDAGCVATVREGVGVGVGAGAGFLVGVGEGDGVSETVAVTVTTGGGAGVRIVLAARAGPEPPEVIR
jgi:hypothetical protein